MQAQVQVQVIHEAPVHDTAVSDKLKLIVEHVGHATYAETVLEWETCLFMRTLPVRLSNGMRIVT